MAIELQSNAAPKITSSSLEVGGRWAERWWRLMERRVGIIPLPVYLLLLGLLVAFVLLKKVTDEKTPEEISMVLAIMVVGGFTCAEIGKRIPIIRNIGGAAIFATFIPSCLAFYNLLPTLLLQPVTTFFKNTNFLYLFITAIIVGSILGMDRQVLIKGFLKIFVPLAVGSAVAAMVGTLVGTSLGMGAYHTFFFTVVPIIAAGGREEAIPLSLGGSGWHDVDRLRRETQPSRIAKTPGGCLRRLQILRHGGGLPFALRRGSGDHTMGQIGRGLPPGQHHHHLRNRCDADGDGLRSG